MDRVDNNPLVFAAVGQGDQVLVVLVQKLGFLLGIRDELAVVDLEVADQGKLLSAG